MLHFQRSSAHKTYYDILSVREDASYDEIRAKYKNAALNSHPDKQSIPLLAKHEMFLEIQKAWEVLSNAESRAVYDRELRALRLDLVLADEVKLKEMQVENIDETIYLSYPCRCGDTFSISCSELAEMGFSFDRSGVLESRESDVAPASVVLPCYSCSLKINLALHGGS